MDHGRATDNQLLMACRRGDDAAAREIYARLSPMLRALARLTLHDPHLAEDAVQRAFCRVMRVPFSEIRGVNNARAWLVRVLRNEVASLARTLARARARDRRYATSRGSACVPNHGEAPARSSPSNADHATNDEIGRAVRCLNEDLREIIHLRHVAGLSFDQIEAATGINRNTASSRHREAVRQIRAILASESDRPARSRPTTRQESTEETSHAARL